MRHHLRPTEPSFYLIATVFVVVVGSCGSEMLRAGEVTGLTWSAGINSVAAACCAAPTAVNNDDVGAGSSPNELFVTQKDYRALTPVDLIFSVVDSTPAGVTEYRVREGVSNSTGVDWTGYHLELGFGSGASFVKSTAGDGLDFDAPLFNSDIEFNNPPSPGFFPTFTTPTEDDIIAGGGTHANGNFSMYHIFHVDVPNGIESFTIRQSPITAAIPEPGSLVLAALGSLSLYGVGWRRRTSTATRWRGFRALIKAAVSIFHFI